MVDRECLMEAQCQKCNKIKDRGEMERVGKTFACESCREVKQNQPKKPEETKPC
ncbi:MAG: hypothetical protein NY202_01565 [Mollicutes bacterium UO1]